MPTSPLIDAPSLRHALQGGSGHATGQPPEAWLIVDCRFNLAQPEAGWAAYLQGHIPGAVYAHLDQALSGPKDGRHGRHPLPAPGAFVHTLQAWGLQPHTRVVACDDSGGMFAARLWWMLRWMGHEAVQVLDGGWQAWLAASGPVEAGTPTARQPSAGSLSWLQPRPEHIVSTEQVLHSLQTSGPLTLIDARAPDRFRGENETLDPVGGHIPGALNRFFQLNLAPDGRFKPANALRAEFTTLLGDTPLAQVVHQCGSGVTACHNLLAMACAGLPETRLYAGSWSAWCADPARPVAR